MLCTFYTREHWQYFTRVPRRRVLLAPETSISAVVRFVLFMLMVSVALDFYDFFQIRHSSPTQNIAALVQCFAALENTSEAPKNTYSYLCRSLGIACAGAFARTKGGTAEAIQAQGHAAAPDSDDRPRGAILRHAGTLLSGEGDRRALSRHCLDILILP